MSIEMIKTFAEERIRLHESNDEECEAMMDDYWERLSSYIAADIPGAIEFMTKSSECTGEIFSDWSEVFDDVVRKTQSREFIDALSIASKRFEKECREYNVADVIDLAKHEIS